MPMVFPPRVTRGVDWAARARAPNIRARVGLREKMGLAATSSTMIRSPHAPSPRRQRLPRSNVVK